MTQSRYNQPWWAKRRSRVWLLGAALASFPAVHAQAPRFSVTSDQVVAAMRGHAWPLEGVRVTLPTAITAAVEDPKLGIETASMLTPHEARLRVVCRVPAACLPFFATAVWPEGADSPPSTVTQSFDRSAGSANRRASAQPAATVAADALKDSSPARLRAGASVTLLLDGERVHIQMQVVCLQGGATGDTIRVATKDRKQTYVAEVLTSTLLKGSLPK